MRKLFFAFIILLAGGADLFAFAAPQAPGRGQAGSVRAYFNYSVFYAPGKGNYIETYLTVAGNSVLFKKSKNRFLATVHVDISFSQEGKQVQGGSYNMNSAEIIDTSSKPVFTGIQRYALKPGKYDMTLKIRDVNREGSELSASQSIEITEPAESAVTLSDFELLESFTKTEVPNDQSKSGYDLFPYVMRHYPETFNKLMFYAEAYNCDRKLGPDERFLFSYYVEGAASREKLAGLQAYSKQKASAVNPFIGQFDLTHVATGEYNLVLEVRSSGNELVAEKRLPFTRIASSVKIPLSDLGAVDTSGTFVSQMMNPDTLKDYIACLWPISTTTERDWQYSQIKNADVKVMQQYLYAFWVNRDSKNPELAWKTYRAEAVKVKKEFACGKIPGYMTDRGRVYLQYGAPSAAQQMPTEPDSYPYEIWQYYRLRDPATGTFQSNKKFVFYNRELDGKCYELIHSDARGELRDDRWQIKLKQRSNQVLNLDETKPKSTYGSNADDLFQNPR
jgi:GWxTD domain-containing protein